VLNREKLEAAKVTFDARFQKALALAQTDPFVAMLAEAFDMSTPTIEFDWMGFVGAVKKWTGARKLEKLGGHNFTMKTAEWEDSIRCSRTDIRDDKLALYMSRVDMLALAFVQHQEELLVNALLGGFLGATDFGECYDAGHFFATNHPLDNGSTNSNLLNHTLDDSGALDAAILLLRQMKRDDGVPLGINPTHLIVGPTNEANGLNLLERQYVDSGSNRDYHRLQLHVSPWIYAKTIPGPTGRSATGNEWFVADLSKPVRPLYKGTREPVWSDSVVTGDDAFSTGELKFGAAASYNVAYAFYQLITGSDATT
jgi:phage major head subunit gpT-like protein